ncbi:hypothetical protein CSC94_18250 [Zhengella mangrovi]|uniref:DUF2125 domain-containing protein n=1 Tax=Zhengella mangrovi TaxID=1982044 RepID=A0A2G1QJA7_9HYPH|nr:DUF2125 domain-containing protein [Zhengella mangrovi]PHP65540.1 hypothetical protein CSC94_18250 [Zhengella mangrovi]
MTRTDKPAPRYARRFIWLAVSIVAAIALYTAGWFYIAGRLEEQTRLALARQAERGVEAECASPEARGYPFRIGLFCDATGWRRPEGGIAVKAGALRTAAQVYAPSHVVGEIDGPAEIDLPGLLPLAADWENLQASVRASRPVPARVSLEARKARLAVRSGEQPPIGTAEDVQLHMRTNQGALDIAAALTGVQVDKALTSGQDLPPLALTADLGMRDGAFWLASGNRSLRGTEGTLRDLSLAIGETSGMRITGPYSVDTQGRLSGDFSLTLRNPSALASLAKKFYPQQARTVDTVLTAVTVAGGSAEGPTLPVSVKDGVPTIGFIRLNPLPPLP